MNRSEIRSPGIASAATGDPETTGTSKVSVSHAPRRRRWLVILALGVVALVVFRQSVAGSWYRFRAATALNELKLEDALRHAQEAVAWQPDDVRSLRLLLSLQRQNDKLPDAATTLQRLQKLGLNPLLIQQEQALLMARTGDPATQDSLLSGLLASDDFRPEEVCDAFILYYRAFARLPAVETLLAAWEADRPDDYRAATHRGLQKQMQMDMAGASESFRKAVALGDPRGSTRLHLGRCLLERRLVAEAISVLDEAVKLTPQDGQSWLLLADAQRQNGDDAAALKSAQECLSIDPGCYEADLLLARTELNLGRPDSALVHVDRLLRDWPQDRDGLYCRMEILRALQRTDEAETAMSNWKLADEQVLELEARLRRLQTDPENDALRSSAAILMMQHFSRSSAVQLLETTLRSRPDDQAARECLEDFHRRRAKRIALAAAATPPTPAGDSR